MGILTGINTKIRGSVGQYTFARLNGQTVVKEKIVSTGNPRRTFRQMLRRAAWANLINIWRAFTGNLHPSFENRDRRVSDYNEFISANAGSNNVYLTAQESRQGGAVVAAYQITRGSLPSVGVTLGDGNIPVTDISMGGITIGSSTTVKTFSEAIIQNNASQNWQDGDQLSVFVAFQSQDPETGVPRVKIDAKEVTLDVTDETNMLGDVVEPNFFSVVDGKLAAGGSLNGAIAAVHSRLTPSGTKVSTQFFVVNNSLLAGYTDENAFKDAAVSYGYDPDQQFLTPNVDDTFPAVTP